MIVCLLLWSMATAASFLVGCRVLVLTGCIDQFDRLGDACFIAIWLGLLVILQVLLALAPFGALTPATALTVATALSFVASVDMRVRRIFAQAIESVTSRPTGAAFGAILLVFSSLAASQSVYMYDTGLYHYPTIKWLASFGEIPGLAILHARFGLITSWFTLPATANHGFLEGRTASLANGYGFLLVAGQCLLAVQRWWTNRQSRADVFFLFSATVILLYGLQGGFVNSASPDLPVMMLTVITAWSYLTVADFRSSVIPFLLALGAITIKMSAMPLLIVTGAILLFQVKLAPKAMLLVALALTFVPLVMNSFISTGCFLFPLSLTCIDVDWSVGRVTAHQIADVVTSWARWGGAAPPNANSWNWIWQWSQRKSSMGFEILLALSLASIAAQWTRLKTDHAFLNVSLLAGAGIAYVFAIAPELRFGIGYLCILPALHSSSGHRLTFTKANAPKWLEPIGLAAWSLGFMVALYVSTGRLGHSENRNGIALNLILPPSLPGSDGRGYVADRSGDLAYFRPVASDNDQCWDMTLPCAPGRAVGVALRDPSKGLSGGFFYKR